MGTNMMARMAQYKFLWVSFAAKRCITTSQLTNLLRPKFVAKICKIVLSAGSHLSFIMVIIM